MARSTLRRLFTFFGLGAGSETPRAAWAKGNVGVAPQIPALHATLADAQRNDNVANGGHGFLASSGASRSAPVIIFVTISTSGTPARL